MIGEHFSFLGPAVSVSVGKNDDPVSQRKVELGGPVAVGKTFSHPQPSLRVPGHGQWVVYFWFRDKNLSLHARRQFEIFRR